MFPSFLGQHKTTSWATLSGSGRLDCQPETTTDRLKRVVKACLLGLLSIGGAHQGSLIRSSGILAAFSLVEGACGNEFIVNTAKQSAQFAPSVAGHGDGEYVVVWQNLAQEGVNWGITAQRMRGEVRLGSEIPVNTYTPNDQQKPDIATLPNKEFVVAWDSISQAGRAKSIALQRFNATGHKIGGEVLATEQRVLDRTLYYEENPRLTRLSRGGFALTFTGRYTPGLGDGADIFLLCFDASANRGDVVLVNTDITGEQTLSSIAGLEDGNLVVVWEDNKDFGSVQARRFNATCGAIDPLQFPVSSRTQYGNAQPSVAGFQNSGFVVTWKVGDVDPDIHRQRFGPDAQKVGGSPRVNTETRGSQESSHVAIFSDDRSVVVWQESSNTNRGDGIDVYGQEYNADDSPSGLEFPLNLAYTRFTQLSPRVAVLGDKTYVVVWASEVPSTGYDIAARLLGSPDPITTSLSSSLTTSSQPTQLITSTVNTATSMVDAATSTNKVTSHIFETTTNALGTSSRAVSPLSTTTSIEKGIATTTERKTVAVMVPDDGSTKVIIILAASVGVLACCLFATIVALSLRRMRSKKKEAVNHPPAAQMSQPHYDQLVMRRSSHPRSLNRTHSRDYRTIVLSPPTSRGSSAQAHIYDEPPQPIKKPHPVGVDQTSPRASRQSRRRTRKLHAPPYDDAPAAPAARPNYTIPQSWKDKDGGFAHEEDSRMSIVTIDS